MGMTTTTASRPAIDILAAVALNLDDRGHARPKTSHGPGWVGYDYCATVRDRTYPKVRVYLADPESDEITIATFNEYGILFGRTVVAGLDAVGIATAVAAAYLAR
jgi:hypothetical protein